MSTVEWGVRTDVHSTRIGPEKGVIHIAAGAVNNALWDMFARARGKPLWKLVVDMTPVGPALWCNTAYEHTVAYSFP